MPPSLSSLSRSRLRCLLSDGSLTFSRLGSLFTATRALSTCSIYLKISHELLLLGEHCL